MTGDGALRAEPSPGAVVETYDETDAGVDDLARWAEVACAALVVEGAGPGRLDLIFVDPDAMTELNRDHMGQDRPTDVLAFPLDGAPDRLDGPPDLAAPPRHLGDVVICPEVARLQAPDHCGSYEAELTLLVVHGVLHVLGHDHAEEDERLVMQARERDHLARHGHRHPVPA